MPAAGTQIQAASRVWFNPDLYSRNYFVPGVIANIVMMITLMLTSLAIVREKEIGTMEQLMVTPVRPIELMLGKTLPFAIVGLIDVMTITGLALLVFRVPLRGSFLLLLACAALFLAVAKRRQEVVTLAAEGAKHRRVLGDYVTPWLDQAGTILAGATIVAYALYTVAPETTTKFKTDHLIYTVPFVLYGVLRYLHLVHSGSASGNPTAALVSDRPLIVCIVGWLAACAVIIY